LKRKVFIFPALLSAFIFCTQSVFAQDKSGLPDLPAELPSQTINDYTRISNKTDFAEVATNDKWKRLKPYLKAESDGEREDKIYDNPYSFQNQEIIDRKVLADAIKPARALSEINKQIVFDTRTEKTEELKSDNQQINRILKYGKNDFFAVTHSRQSAAAGSFNNDGDANDDSDKDNDPKYPREGFQWRSAIEQSLLFLAVQHGYALTQPKTRSALKGEFFNDYIKSVKSLRGWGDGGRFFTNYIAHPMQGSFMGFIQIHNDPKGKRQRFGGSKDYWQSRMKAMAWSAAWSTQFEIGPLSQASIGNVGLKGKQTYVDLVITPTLGTAMLITEDAIDRFLIESIEGKINNYYLMIFSRILLNPTRTVANLIRFKLPWYRDRPRVY